ncbi:sugar ABC transporter permease [Bacillus shivajii]|uniref:carbohydrate ABC transporter permease n=1 Tax=Bacillus shivajii TaxID=1983719 RepID=UPI001CF937D9|nr:sugar ABC transporter permease [Bacillus shivajii]
MGSYQTVKETNKKTVVLKKQKKKTFSKESLLAYLFISPFLLGLGTFFLVPAAASFYLSFTTWDGLSAPDFSGLANFINLLQDQTFIRAMLNTFVFTILSVPASMVIATLIATLLNQKIKGMVIYRTLYFIPVITMPVAVGMVWRWLYNSEYGLLNFSLSLLNLPQPAWLFDERFALISIVIASVWMTVGNSTVILLAGLQGIPQSYYEAAVIDGASDIKKFFYITIPLLSPSLFFVLVISMINSLQVFDLVYMMMGENVGLLYPTRTIVYSMWEHGFRYFNMGYASAQALMLFIIILVLTIIQLYFQKKWVHY